MNLKPILNKMKLQHTSSPCSCTTATMEDDIEDMDEEEKMEEDEDDVEDEDDDDDDDEVEIEKPPSNTKSKGRRKPRSVLTGRGVTLSMLLDDGVMEPGEKCLSIDYLVSFRHYVWLLQWNPDFLNPQFFVPPVTLKQKSFPLPI